MVNCFFIQNAGFFYFKGNDRIDFLNRISTNDFSSFKKNEYIKTLLTTEKGRIVDLITIFEYGDYSIIKTTIENYKSAEDYLKKYIFSEDVIIEKPDSNFHLITLEGDNIIDFVNKEYNIPKTEGRRFFTLSNNNIIYFDTYDVTVARILCDMNNLSETLQSLSKLHKMEPDEFDNFYIQNNIFESADELNEEVNPLECGLDKYISFEKGCYIGQEVIARLDSQQKLPKQIVRFESDIVVHKNDKLFYREKDFALYECGYINKVVKKNERYTGFAFIKNIYLNLSKKYFTKDNYLINIYKIN